MRSKRRISQWFHKLEEGADIGMSLSSTLGSYSLVRCDEGGAGIEKDIVSKASF
jgi:hypothetical protein